MPAPAIETYALIGDCRTAALVSRDGSIDWLCWPRFDRPSMFAAILDDAGGSFAVRPRDVRKVERRYVEGTNVLQTRFDCEGGVVELIDLMPVYDEDDKRRMLVPEHELLRCVRCLRGEVEVSITFDPRPNYGRDAGKLRDRGKLGWQFECGAGVGNLLCDVPLAARPQGGAHARVRLAAGDERFLSLSYTEEAPGVIPMLGDVARASIERTIAWWRAWSSRARYDGPRREAVIRSALTLKLLAYAPSGAIVAAPTTSLPEQPGGSHNWDYRFCWLRDASFTARALFGLGYHAEAESFVDWMVHTTALARPELRVLYDVFGESPCDERELPHLGGYRGARPVRVGNAARDQLQLDVYGEVIEAATQLIRVGGELDRATLKMLGAFGGFVCGNWQRPDQGIWEPREPPSHHTHSKLLCWSALDRLLELDRRGVLTHRDVGCVRRARAELRHAIETRAWNERVGSYVSTFDGDALDASALLLPWYGFEPADSSRMRRTYAAVTDALSPGGDLLYRYRADPPGKEGAFGICGFWAAEYLALGGGSVDDAIGRFERLLAYGNDVGLFAEEIDPSTGAAMGNFPQAFTHVGVINAALTIGERLRGDERRHLPGAPWHAQPQEVAPTREMHP